MKIPYWSILRPHKFFTGCWVLECFAIIVYYVFNMLVILNHLWIPEGQFPLFKDNSHPLIFNHTC